MRKILNILVVVIALGLGGGYFVFGPSFFLGGPKISDIVTVTRAVMVETAPGPSEAEAAKQAKISPQGICSGNADGSHGCAVEVEIPGSPAKVLVTELVKDTTGTWVAKR